MQVFQWVIDKPTLAIKQIRIRSNISHIPSLKIQQVKITTMTRRYKIRKLPVPSQNPILILLSEHSPKWMISIPLIPFMKFQKMTKNHLTHRIKQNEL